MAQQTMNHKGYRGSILVEPKDYSLKGQILFLKETIEYQGETFAELEAAFQAEVDKHIERCRAAGVEPPFSES